MIPGLGRSSGEETGNPLQFSWASLVGGSDSKESACNAGGLDLIPGLGRSPGEGKGYPLQCSCLENSMDRGAWRALVHGAAKSQTGLSDFDFLIKVQAHCYSEKSAVLTVLLMTLPFGKDQNSYKSSLPVAE